jgi:hypothetical protein
MTCGDYVHSSYTAHAKSCCGGEQPNSCFIPYWGCCWLSWYEVRGACGIPESWGIIFTCCELCPIDETNTIREYCKCYQPCSDDHRTTSWNHTCTWIKDEIFCGGLYSICTGELKPSKVAKLAIGSVKPPTAAGAAEVKTATAAMPPAAQNYAAPATVSAAAVVPGSPEPAAVVSATSVSSPGAHHQVGSDWSHHHIEHRARERESELTGHVPRAAPRRLSCCCNSAAAIMLVD